MTPNLESSFYISLPIIPASMQAIMLFLSTHLTLFILVQSTEMMVRFSVCWHIKLSVTFVPLNYRNHLPSKRNQNDVVFLRLGNKMLGLLMGSNVNYVVYDSRQLGVTQVVQFLHWVTMRMEDSRIFASYDFVNMALDGFDELWMFNWRISRDLLLGFWGGIDIEADDSFNPLLELGHFLSWELIPASRNVNWTVIIQNEFSILESPAVILEPLLFISDVLWSLDGLLFENCL